MSVHRKRARRRPPVAAPASTPSTSAAAPPDTPASTVAADVRELVALWPRLEAGLARDGAGPSAAPSGPGGNASKGSPAVADLDTVSIIGRIERGVRELEGEALPLLNEPTAGEIANAVRASGRRIAARRRHHIEMLAGLHQHVDSVRAELLAAVEPDEAAASALNELLDRARPRREQLAAAIAAGDAALDRHRIRAAAAARRLSTVGTLLELPTWHARLEETHQPLAGHIADDVVRWRRQARAVLGLSTRDVGLGYTCPRHPDEPTELLRDRDEAQLSDDLLDRGRGALVWHYAKSVHCPHCKHIWTGLEELSALMRRIDSLNTRDA